MSWFTIIPDPNFGIERAHVFVSLNHGAGFLFCTHPNFTDRPECLEETVYGIVAPGAAYWDGDAVCLRHMAECFTNQPTTTEESTP